MGYINPILDTTASLPTGEDKVEQQTNPMDDGGWSSSELSDEELITTNSA